MVVSYWHKGTHFFVSEDTFYKHLVILDLHLAFHQGGRYFSISTTVLLHGIGRIITFEAATMILIILGRYEKMFDDSRCRLDGGSGFGAGGASI